MEEGAQDSGMCLLSNMKGDEWRTRSRSPYTPPLTPGVPEPTSFYPCHCPVPTDVVAMETPRAPEPPQNGPLSLAGISILDRLIKTCPVWLQLCMGAPQVEEILCREAAGVFLVTRDVEVKRMVLWVRSPESAGAAAVLRYNIREEKTMMYLEGSMLVFKDIFKLVAFYCISRDILPSVLKLPPAISGAQSLQDLEEISNLGTGFWDKHNTLSSSSQSGKSPAPENLCSDHVRRRSRELGDCACEIEICAEFERLWFVTPIFIEDCSNADSSPKLPLTNCTAKAELPKMMHRRPPPPPPMLHKPPLPSVPPSAPPPNYKRPQSESSPLKSPAPPRPATSKRGVPAEPPPSKTLTDLPPFKTLIDPPPSGTLTDLPPSGTLTDPPPSGTLIDPPPSGTLIDPPPSGTLTGPPPSGTLIEPPPSKTTTCPPLSSPQSSGTPTEPQSSETPSKSPSFEPPKSLDLSSSPKTSSHNLVDLLDHPIGSPLEPSPDPYSQTSSGLQSSPSTSPPSDCPPLLTSHHKDDEDPQPEACLLPSLDVDLLKEPLKNMKINALCNDSPQQGPQTPSPVRAPPAVPRRRPSGKVPESKVSIVTMKDEAEPRSPAPKSETPTSDKTGTPPKQHGAMEETRKKTPPVPPPRTKKLSGRLSSVSPVKVGPEKLIKTSESQSNSSGGKAADRRVSRQKRVSAPALKSSDLSLSSQGSDPTMATADADSYSTSSADEESEPPSKASIKKSHSFMLERAKNRLSMVAITNVFSAFMSADRKLQKKIAELAHDKDSYFGNLVQDYKTYSLEMMAKQSSSTEMLQEIRLMMTQLKSYLVQSAELKAMVDYSLYTDDKIDAIVESALCKCVLKPLKSAIECYLREIHNKDGALRLLTENQQVIQETTTTDLGVTTSVPDSGVMEKILHKFSTMHKTYSPEKKITYLLKACKLIYDSMAAGNPGKPHGADDFLPVLMYVLAQCDLVALLLDVEYMMELMDPALQLGEGSYYLTTTYGALEHIKNYDKITVTRQLSVEVQDSIHRWERRRTLNKAKVSRSSIQDFITISFEELDSNTRTLATKADMNVAEVVRQCAEKFEVSEAADYGLFVTVNERCVRLTEDAFPQQVKSRLLKNEHKLDFHFIYKRTGAQDMVMSELHFL